MMARSTSERDVPSSGHCNKQLTATSQGPIIRFSSEHPTIRLPNPVRWAQTDMLSHLTAAHVSCSADTWRSSSSSSSNGRCPPGASSGATGTRAEVYGGRIAQGPQRRAGSRKQRRGIARKLMRQAAGAAAACWHASLMQNSKGGRDAAACAQSWASRKSMAGILRRYEVTLCQL